jgi:predicted deacylase
VYSLTSLRVTSAPSKKRDIEIRADQSSAVVRRTLTALARGSRCLIVRLVLPRLQ